MTASTVVRAAGYDRSFGALSITSDPPGATVYVDGEVVGQTPLTVDQLPAGDHRVKIVKAGFLENGRVVTVTNGQSKNVNVKLTAGTSSGSSSAALAPGGSTKKWLIGLGVLAAGAGIYFATKSSNKAPTSAASASRTTALQGTSVVFNANASDPDGDALTYTWDFGDGGTGSGASPSHVYTTTGTFNATVTVSDGKKSVTSSVTVTVRSLTGQWRGPILGLSTFPTTVNLTQNGNVVTGTYTDSLTNFNGTLSLGSVSADGTVTFQVNIPGIIPFTFTGPIDAAVNVMNGRANGSGFNNASWVLTRQ